MRWVRPDTPLNIKPATTILLQIRPIQSSLNQLVMQIILTKGEYGDLKRDADKAELFKRLLAILRRIDEHASAELRIELYNQLIGQLHYRIDMKTDEQILIEWEDSRFSQWVETVRRRIFKTP